MKNTLKICSFYETCGDPSPFRGFEEEESILYPAVMCLDVPFFGSMQKQFEGKDSRLMYELHSR